MQYPDHEFYNCKIQLSDGTSHLIEANWLHNNNLDHWQGWQCDAGYSRISIDSDDNVHGGQCANDYLGKLNSEWDILPSSTICKKIRCNGCTDDLIVRKQASANDQNAY